MLKVKLQNHIHTYIRYVHTYVLGLVRLLNTIEFVQRYKLSAIQNGMCYNNTTNH